MRFFDWTCPNCKTTKEFFENFNNDVHTCENCGGEMKRIISNPLKVNFKNLPKGHNLSATERRRLWDSNEPSDFRKLM